MTTKELIKKLKEIDPDGNMQVIIDGCFYGYEIENVIKCEGVDPFTEEVNSCWIELS